MLYIYAVSGYETFIRVPWFPSKLSFKGRHLIRHVFPRWPRLAVSRSIL